MAETLVDPGELEHALLEGGNLPGDGFGLATQKHELETDLLFDVLQVVHDLLCERI